MFEPIDYLRQAAALLDEVQSIGLWSRADDCSDNRRRRQALREADWAVADAYRRLVALPSELASEAKAIDEMLEVLPDLVTDIMLNLPPELDAQIDAARTRIELLMKHLEGVIPPA